MIELWAAESGVNVMCIKILLMLLMKAHFTDDPTSGARSCKYGVNIAAFTMDWGLLVSSGPGEKYQNT